MRGSYGPDGSEDPRVACHVIILPNGVMQFDIREWMDSAECSEAARSNRTPKGGTADG